MGMGETKLLETEDVAKLLNCSAEAVRQLVRAKRLPCVRVSARRWRYSPSDVHEFINRERRQSLSAPVGAPMDQPKEQPIPGWWDGKSRLPSKRVKRTG